MTPIIVVQPAVEPVLLEEAMLWTKAADEEATDIVGLISAAREYCEWRKGYAFYEQTLRVSFSGWPCGSRRYIDLPRATPLRSIVSVAYTDDTGAHVVDGADYAIDTISTPGRIVFVEEYSWPSIDVWAPNPIVIDYVAGTGVTSPETAFTPAAVKLAMKQLIAHWYRNKEAVVVGSAAAATSVPMELGVDALLGVNQAIYAF